MCVRKGGRTAAESARRRKGGQIGGRESTRRRLQSRGCCGDSRTFPTIRTESDRPAATTTTTLHLSPTTPSSSSSRRLSPDRLLSPCRRPTARSAPRSASPSLQCCGSDCCGAASQREVTFPYFSPQSLLLCETNCARLYFSIYFTHTLGAWLLPKTRWTAAFLFFLCSCSFFF